MKKGEKVGTDRFFGLRDGFEAGSNLSGVIQMSIRILITTLGFRKGVKSAHTKN